MICRCFFVILVVFFFCERKKLSKVIIYFLNRCLRNFFFFFLMKWKGCFFLSRCLMVLVQVLFVFEVVLRIIGLFWLDVCRIDWFFGIMFIRLMCRIFSMFFMFSILFLLMWSGLQWVSSRCFLIGFLLFFVWWDLEVRMLRIWLEL